ncbi:SprT-like family-domain-containing protein [Paraphoma chrysanthemicola]|nr:SprT-like family-domain-containing protein [Paraphoma chrysanthemicola]
MLTDEDAALQAVATLEELSTEQKVALNAVNTVIHNGEPFVDVHELFARYNVLYFRGLLLPRVEILWSPRLTLCAGICELSRDPSTKKFTRIRLKLSTPLLQYRPRSDTINTLLHEAIHAYFFITTSWRHSRGDDGTGHGVGFQLLADAINNHGNYDITIYHTFHDEVESYRTHVWQCDGPCKTRPPFFGLVKRSMNRAPGKGDTWWARHEAECGGVYTKIQEPAMTKKQLDAMSAKERAGKQKNKLDSWIKGSSKAPTTPSGSTSDRPIDLDDEYEGSKVAIRKRKASTLVAEDVIEKDGPMSGHKRSRPEEDAQIVEHKVMVQCPICDQTMAERQINDHLDGVHTS